MKTIYCNNLECAYCEKLVESMVFKPTKGYKPFLDSKYYGQCVKEGYEFVPIGYEDGDVLYELASCYGGDKIKKCSRKDCSWNNNCLCDRDIIYIDKFMGGFWICKVFSNRHISGHINILNYPQKGGVSLTDSEADKLDHDNRVTKMYPTHLRPYKERPISRLKQEEMKNKNK